MNKEKNKNVTENCTCCGGIGVQICTSCNGIGVALFSLPFFTSAPYYPCAICRGKCFIICTCCDGTGKAPN